MAENAQEVAASAATWAVRIDRGLTDQERDSLDVWLAGDVRRTGALARAQAAWVHVDRSRVYRTDEALRRSLAAKGWRRALPPAVAALLILGIGASFLSWQRYSRDQLSTSVGEIRVVPLTDGSRVTLDTASRVSVNYQPATRLVRLESGTALFSVAKDPARPFVVVAGNTRVRAVGTAFIVRRRSDEDVEVTVTQGTVDVWREAGSPEPAVRLSAGNRTLTTPAQVAPPEPLSNAQLAGAIAWEEGVIDLNGRTLGEAAAEFNRYNRQSVEIADPQLAAQTVVGRFRSNNPTAFVNAAAAMLGARVRTDGDRLILESRNQK